MLVIYELAYTNIRRLTLPSAKEVQQPLDQTTKLFEIAVKSDICYLADRTFEDMNKTVARAVEDGCKHLVMGTEMTLEAIVLVLLYER
jgi:hypothetical protein